VLNLVESWHHQASQASMESAFKDAQIENINDVIGWFFGYPGSAEAWNKVIPMFVPIHHIVDKKLK